MPTCHELLHLPTCLQTFRDILHHLLIAKCPDRLHLQLLMPAFRELPDLPNSDPNFSRLTSPFQLRLPTFRKLLDLPTSHANFSSVTLLANFSCQVSRITSPANLSCQLFQSYFTCINLPLFFRATCRLVCEFSSCRAVDNAILFVALLVRRRDSTLRLPIGWKYAYQSSEQQRPTTCKKSSKCITHLESIAFENKPAPKFNYISTLTDAMKHLHFTMFRIRTS